MSPLNDKEKTIICEFCNRIVGKKGICVETNRPIFFCNIKCQDDWNKEAEREIKEWLND